MLRVDIHTMCDALFGLDRRLICANRKVVGVEEAICVTLMRLAYPTRLEQIKNLFSMRHKGDVSHVFNCCLNYLMAKYRHILHFWPGIK